MVHLPVVERGVVFVPFPRLGQCCCCCCCCSGSVVPIFSLLDPGRPGGTLLNIDGPNRRIQLLLHRPRWFCTRTARCRSTPRCPPLDFLWVGGWWARLVFYMDGH